MYGLGTTVNQADNHTSYIYAQKPRNNPPSMSLTASRKSALATYVLCRDAMQNCLPVASSSVVVLVYISADELLSRYVHTCMHECFQARTDKSICGGNAGSAIDRYLSRKYTVNTTTRRACACITADDTLAAQHTCTQYTYVWIDGARI